MASNTFDINLVVFFKLFKYLTRLDTGTFYIAVYIKNSTYTYVLSCSGQIIRFERIRNPERISLRRHNFVERQELLLCRLFLIRLLCRGNVVC